MKFKGDIIITDPCYILKYKDFETSNYGENLENLGFTSYMARNTIYGDWSCTTFKHDISNIEEYLEGLEEDGRLVGEEIGTFCADAGMVGVFLLMKS